MSKAINYPTVINKSVVHGIGVPDYSNTSEEYQQMYLQNKYTRIYNNIIEQAKTRTINRKLAE